MKKKVFFVLTFLFILSSTSQCLSFGYEIQQEEEDRIEKIIEDVKTQKNKDNAPCLCPCPCSTNQNAQDNNSQSGNKSVNVNGFTVKSNNPITVLPPGSGSVSLKPRENKTYVRPNSGGGLQVIGQDASITPNQ